MEIESGAGKWKRDSGTEDEIKTGNRNRYMGESRMDMQGRRDNRIEDVMECRMDKGLQCHGYVRGRLLGTGAFARVWQVEKHGSGEGYACKISTRTELLRREADILKRLEHPLFPRFQEFWEDGMDYLVMELVCGTSIKQLVERRGHLTQKQAVRIARELASGLRFLHEMPVPVLYRDLKPEHVYIRQDGSVKLLDMGCACPVTQINSMAGTPGFAAGEQLTPGMAQSVCSDIYAWGKLLLYMLTGECTGRLQSPALQLEPLINQCIADSPDRRLPGFRMVLNELNRLEERILYGKKHIYRILPKKKSSEYHYRKSIFHHSSLPNPTA